LTRSLAEPEPWLGLRGATLYKPSFRHKVSFPPFLCEPVESTSFSDIIDESAPWSKADLQNSAQMLTCTRLPLKGRLPSRKCLLVVATAKACFVRSCSGVWLMDTPHRRDSICIILHNYCTYLKLRFLVSPSPRGDDEPAPVADALDLRDHTDHNPS
jgi:hypothetical protein